MFNNLEGLELIFSGECNMRCKYCYIHKNPEKMHEYNKAIQQSIEDGTFVKNLLNTIGEQAKQIHDISFWGAEPTINANYFKKLFIDLFDAFYNANIIMFSTNALLGIKALSKCIDAVNKYTFNNKRKITFEIQFSLDGPPYINDTSRHPGAADNTIKTIMDCIQYVKDTCINNEYFNLSFNTKSTVSIEWMDYLAQNPDKMYEWFKYFDDLQKQGESYGLPFSKLNLALAGYPTIVDPGDYSRDDGIKFMNFIKALRKVDCSKFESIKHPLYRHPYRLYNSAIWFNRYYMLNFPFSYGVCSAGCEAFSFDYKGNLISCHRTIDNLYSLDPVYLQHAKDVSTLDLQNEKKDMKMAQLEYTERSYHANGLSRFIIFREFLASLVYSGYLDKKYLNADLARWVYTCISTVNCYIGTLEITGSRYTPPLSYINLFCFGAAEELYLYYESLSDHRKEFPWHQKENL